MRVKNIETPEELVAQLLVPMPERQMCYVGDTTGFVLAVEQEDASGRAFNVKMQTMKSGVKWQQVRYRKPKPKVAPKRENKLAPDGGLDCQIHYENPATQAAEALEQQGNVAAALVISDNRTDEHGRAFGDYSEERWRYERKQGITGFNTHDMWKRSRQQKDNETLPQRM